MVDSLSDRFPVILTADRNYEQYNLFAHAEERLLIMSSESRISAAAESFPALTFRRRKSLTLPGI